MTDDAILNVLKRRMKPLMKRMSIAEQTLKKQIDLLHLKREAVLQEIGKLQEQETVYTSMIFDIETEQQRLRAIREINSDLRKPKL